MTTAFFAKGAEWLEGRAAAGQIRKLSFLEYYVLWMGPTLELTRTWLMNVQQKWTWMPDELCRPAASVTAVTESLEPFSIYGCWSWNRIEHGKKILWIGQRFATCRRWTYEGGRPE